MGPLGWYGARLWAFGCLHDKKITCLPTTGWFLGRIRHRAAAPWAQLPPALTSPAPRPSARQGAPGLIAIVIHSEPSGQRYDVPCSVQPGESERQSCSFNSTTNTPTPPTRRRHAADTPRTRRGGSRRVTPRTRLAHVSHTPRLAQLAPGVTPATTRTIWGVTTHFGRYKKLSPPAPHFVVLFIESNPLPSNPLPNRHQRG